MGEGGQEHDPRHQHGPPHGTQHGTAWHGMAYDRRREACCRQHSFFFFSFFLFLSTLRDFEGLELLPLRVWVGEVHGVSQGLLLSKRGRAGQKEEAQNREKRRPSIDGSILSRRLLIRVQGQRAASNRSLGILPGDVFSGTGKPVWALRKEGKKPPCGAWGVPGRGKWERWHGATAGIFFFLGFGRLRGSFYFFVLVSPDLGVGRGVARRRLLRTRTRTRKRRVLESLLFCLNFDAFGRKSTKQKELMAACCCSPWLRTACGGLGREAVGMGHDDSFVFGRRRRWR